MIHPLIWKGRPIPDRVSRTTFPRQEPPTSYQRGLWRRLLRTLLQPSSTSASLRLLNSLGSWTAESTMRWGLCFGTLSYTGATPPPHTVLRASKDISRFTFPTISYLRTLLQRSTTIQSLTGTRPLSPPKRPQRTLRDVTSLRRRARQAPLPVSQLQLLLSRNG